jgi:hypothetical protein
LIRRVTVILVALSLVGCGETTERDAAGWKAEADRLFAQGAFVEAASAYRSSFRVEDPVPARSAARALLAFRRARALWKAVEAEPASAWNEDLAQDALLWLEQAGRLAPDMRQVWYERGRWRESPHASVRDHGRAREAYARYLALLEAAAPVPEAERPRARHARERLETLTGPPALR